jgi:hypothetical protein
MKHIFRTLAFTGVIAAAAAAAQAQVFVRAAPPAPIYYSNIIPACPGVGYVWTPGYYAGAFWTPGRWIYRHDFPVMRRGYRFDHRGWDHKR